MKTSINENIRKYRKEHKLTQEQLAEAMCVTVGAVSKWESGLSGGERQRISIARCLLRKTPILLVDEATAALDSETAFQVSNSILELDGLTRIVVTHSLDSALLKKYDGVLVLKNGAIVESGSFDELMSRKEYFYSLFTVSQ